MACPFHCPHPAYSSMIILLCLLMATKSLSAEDQVYLDRELVDEVLHHGNVVVYCLKIHSLLMFCQLWMEEEPVKVKEDEFKSPSNTWLASPQCHFWHVNLSFLLRVRMGNFDLLHPDLLVPKPRAKTSTTQH